MKAFTVDGSAHVVMLSIEGAAEVELRRARTHWQQSTWTFTHTPVLSGSTPQTYTYRLLTCSPQVVWPSVSVPVTVYNPCGQFPSTNLTKGAAAGES